MSHTIRLVPTRTWRLVGLILTGVLLVACQPIVDAPLAEGSATGQEEATELVAAVVGAPIAPDGNVAGAPTDLIINLNRSMEPSVPGRSLLQGKTIKITLPEAFENMGLPVETMFTEDCAPNNFQCSTAILLQGWPQYPLLPMAPPGSGPPQFYTVSLEGTHTLVFTALADVTPGSPLPGPGLKQIHLIALGFVNPEAGVYEVEVVAETGPDGAVEREMAQVEIVPETAPQISVTSVFNEGAPNTIYQQTSVGELTPLPYDFLLWDQNGNPMEGVSIEMVDATRAQFMQNEEVVGHIAIEAPAGATGQEIVTEAPSEAIPAPVIGVPTARLTAHFRAGSTPGEYKLTFTLNDGNAVDMFVTVDDAVAAQRIPADAQSPSGHSVATDCQDPAAEYPYAPYDWPDARATLALEQRDGRSTVTIHVRDARPNTYYTAWLRLQGEDRSGEAFGGNPLTGGGATPLAPTTELGNLLMATGEGNGSDQLANGFYTDDSGNATFAIELDFPIRAGAYPFQRFATFDPSDARFPIDNPRIYPVAIVGAQGPFTIRLASHCVDSQGHGLVPGHRESWFQWTLTP